MTVGHEFYGEIVEVGQGVTDFRNGDPVYGCVGGFSELPGVLTEFALADARLLAHKPRNLSFEEAAALPLVAITSWNALVGPCLRPSPCKHACTQ